MKVSEITVAIVKEYCRIDPSIDDNLVESMLAGAITYAKSYTGLTDEELNSYDDIPIAIWALCADMYDNRSFTMTGIQVNPVAAQILGSHSKNLI